MSDAQTTWINLKLSQKAEYILKDVIYITFWKCKVIYSDRMHLESNFSRMEEPEKGESDR